MLNELATHIWQSTVFAAVIGLLTFAFRKNRAQIRHWLWLSASLKFFAPFALLIGFGSHLGWAPAAQKIATPAVSFAVEYVAQPFPATISFAPSRFAPSGVSRDWTPFLIVGLWLIGCSLITLIRLRLWLRIRVAVRKSVPLNIPSAVEIRSAAGLLEPGVVGLWRPTLLLPEGIMERLTSSELEAVIAHELCHVRRRDNLLSSIHMVAEALFWFHPLVWWIGARLLEERERACDESVLSLGNQPRVYADAILNVCKLYTESPLVCVSGVTGSDIKRRIEVIMANRIGLKLNGAKKFLLAGAGVAALALPVAVGVLIAVGHLPAIHAQAPPAVPVLLPAPVQMAQVAQVKPQSPVKTDAPLPAPLPVPAVSYQDRRLVAMFFDFAGTTSDDQARLQQYAINFVNDGLKPADLVCVMVAGGGQVRVVQDFTDNKSLLQSAVQGIGSASGAGDIDARLANIETTSKMLAGFPEKKAVIYFSSGITQSGPDNQARVREVLVTATMANVAIYPVDPRSTVGPVIGAASASGRGGSMPALVKPAGISPNEYNQRVADAQQKFGSTSNEMARTYIMYGPPDQIETNPNAQTPSEIWRYNYLSNFHSSVEFEFSQRQRASSPWLKKINYPPALATYTGTPAEANALAQALRNENSGRGQSPATATGNGLPVRHTTMGVYPAGEYSKLSVPLDSLSGAVDILAQIKARSAAGVEEQVVGTLRDTVTLNGTSQSGMYGTEFMLEAGSYVCRVLVREAATGRIFTEAINFDVK
jgi:beta-lactamase regulating signal transducer with metallopeptidase domain